jgi:uncharacterized protein YndB with AHSA1/START domain
MRTPLDPLLDLTFTRVVALSPQAIWQAWTDPDLIVQWFTPRPWQTLSAEVDLRPGGVFETVMRSPEGQDFPNAGCYLVVEPERRLVWTNTLSEGFRPVAAPEAGGAGYFGFTAEIDLVPVAAQTRYKATVRHASPEACRAHAAMGFEAGWAAALDQLVALMSV